MERGIKRILILFFMISIISCTNQELITQRYSHLGVNQSFTSMTIHELHKILDSNQEIREQKNNSHNQSRNPTKVFANIEGYVVKVYKCPNCPTGAQCKPCMGNNILISEKNEIQTGYDYTSSTELILFINNPTQFELGKEYRFSVVVSKTRYATLAGYKLITTL